MISELINSMQIRGISIPIAICLFIMMYPAMLNVSAKELRKLGKHPHPIILTLISNWLIAPFVGMYLASIFLQGSEQLIVAVILLSASPCTAMVLVWGYLAKGNAGHTLVMVAINSLVMLFLFGVIGGFLLGVGQLPVPWEALVLSISIYVALPLFAGFFSRRWIVAHKGLDWFEQKFLHILTPITIIALLLTLVLLFSFKGDVIIENPLTILWIVGITNSFNPSTRSSPSPRPPPWYAVELSA